MSPATSLLAVVILVSAPTSVALAQPTSLQSKVTPAPVAGNPTVTVEESAVGDTRLALDVGIGTLSISERYYNTSTYRAEDVVVWSVVGCAADVYLGWIVSDAGALRIELGYRLSTLFDDTAAFHAHEVVGVFRINGVSASLGVGGSGVTSWDEPGILAPRLSVSGQVAVDLVGELHLAFDTGVIWNLGDEKAIKRFAFMLGYTL